LEKNKEYNNKYEIDFDFLLVCNIIENWLGDDEQRRNKLR